jgi:alpha-tubulin suppressor-like RCC1 family protein
MSGGRIAVARIGLAVALTATGLMAPVVAAPAAVAGTSRLEITAGNDVTCAKLLDGTARCWGNGKWGQIGNVHLKGAPMPVVVNGLSNVIAISAGSRTTCALLADRNVKCWGLRLGSRHFGAAPLPPGFTNALGIAVGGAYACVVRVGGTVRCAGYNESGELGHGDINNHATPVGVHGITNATTVSAGATHACAVLADKTVKCWGKDRTGELGNGSLAKRVLTPVTVNGISNAIGVAAGGSAAGDGHTCALLADRTVKCWGSNASGQLGSGGVSKYSLTPVSVTGLTGVAAISAGYGYTCAVLVSGPVECWGYNAFGMLGNGTMTSSATPVAVRGITNAVEISAGSEHACAALADNSARCWGYNDYGQLGTRHGKFSLVPVTVPGI